MAAAPATLFNSLSQHSRRWTLTRKLRSDNPADINGELKGIATFTPLPPRPQTKEMLYREEGEMPSMMKVPGMAGLKWTKKYIWRLNEEGSGEEGNSNSNADPPVEGSSHSYHGQDMSVWFVKTSTHMKMNQERQPPQENEEDEADYLFHEFDFDFDFSKDPRASPSSGIQQQLKTHTDIVDENKHRTKDQDNRTTPETEPEPEISIAPPAPPLGSLLQQQQPAVAEKTTILNARGHHLCINDVYQTAYSFRVRSDTGEVLSWASRHVVKGPKKNQDIVNFYERESTYSN
jgi:hypothetical protein